jgi:hypothetical protein
MYKTSFLNVVLETFFTNSAVKLSKSYFSLASQDTATKSNISILADFQAQPLFSDVVHFLSFTSSE